MKKCGDKQEKKRDTYEKEHIGMCDDYAVRFGIQHIGTEDCN